MARSKLREALLLALGTLLSACGSTLADVPKLSAHQVDFGGMPVLAGHAIAMRVVDERPAALRKNQVELEKSLAELIAQVFASRQLSLTPDAPLHFTLTVRDTAQIPETRPYPRERCVALFVLLAQGSDWSVNAHTFSCHHMRNLFGMTVGGNISEAYRMALSKLLGMVAQQVQQMGPPTSTQISAGGERGSKQAETALVSVRVWPPSAQVFIDGVAQPSGSVNALKLPAGTHRVRVEATGLTPYEGTVPLHPRHHDVLNVRLSAPERFGSAPR